MGQCKFKNEKSNDIKEEEKIHKNNFNLKYAIGNSYTVTVLSTVSIQPFVAATINVTVYVFANV